MTRPEAIPYASPEERTEARKAFWTVVTRGHGTHDWSRACALYWKAVSNDTA